MVVNLSELEFENDFFAVDTPDNGILIFNKVEESISSGSSEMSIDTINIETAHRDDDGYVVFESCPTVIGLSGKRTVINTEHTEYLGTVLTSKNMIYCTLEYYE